MKFFVFPLIFAVIFISVCLSHTSSTISVDCFRCSNLQMDEEIFENFCTHVKKSGWYKWNELSFSKQIEQLEKLSDEQIRILYRLDRLDWVVYNEIETYSREHRCDNPIAQRIVEVNTRLGHTFINLLSKPVLLSDVKVLIEIYHSRLITVIFDKKEDIEEWFEESFRAYCNNAQDVNDRFELIQAIVPWELPSFAVPLLAQLFKTDIPPDLEISKLWKWFGLHMDYELLRTIFTNYAYNKCDFKIMLYIFGTPDSVSNEEDLVTALNRALNLEGLDLRTKIYVWNMVVHAEMSKFDRFGHSAWKEPEIHLRPYAHHIPEEYYNLLLGILQFEGSLSERLQLKLCLDSWLKKQGLSWKHVKSIDGLFTFGLSQYEEVQEKSDYVLTIEYDQTRVLLFHIHYIWLDEKGFELYSYTGRGEKGSRFLSPYHVTWDKNVLYFDDPVGNKKDTFKLSDTVTISSINRFGDNYLVLFSIDTNEEEKTEKRTHRKSREEEVEEMIAVGISKLGSESSEFQALDVRKIWPGKRNLRGDNIKFGVVGENMYFYCYYELCIYNLVTGETTIHKADKHDMDYMSRFHYCTEITFKNNDGKKLCLVLSSNYDMLYDPETETMPNQRYFKRKEEIDN